MLVVVLSEVLGVGAGGYFMGDLAQIFGQQCV